MTQFEMIERVRCEVQFAELFQLAFHEARVGGRIAELICMPGFVRAGDIQLFVGHVHAGHMPVRANQFCQGKDIASRTTAKVQHIQPVERRRNGEAAAIVARGHLIMHGRQRGGDMGRGPGICRAGIGLQVRRTRQGLAIIGLHHILHLVHVTLRI